MFSSRFFTKSKVCQCNLSFFLVVSLWNYAKHKLLQISFQVDSNKLLSKSFCRNFFQPANAESYQISTPFRYVSFSNQRKPISARKRAKHAKLIFSLSLTHQIQYPYFRSLLVIVWKVRSPILSLENLREIVRQANSRKPANSV